MKLKELSKNKYGKLTVIREYQSRYSNGRPCRKLECLCDCGKITNPVKEKVVGGKTQSCGCGQEEMRKNLGKRVRLNKGESAINQVYQVYRKTSRKRGYDFHLTRDEFVSISTKSCIYCGDKLTNRLIKKDGYGSFEYTGIDRYDNSIGYTLENSVPCCKKCNRIKTDMNAKELYAHLIKMIDNNIFWQRTA